MWKQVKTHISNKTMESVLWLYLKKTMKIQTKIKKKHNVRQLFKEKHKNTTRLWSVNTIAA